MLNTLHLFAGAGGGILADLINGHNPKYAVEYDPYCCAVLRKRFPSLCVIESDVRTVDFSSMVGIDAICGGFPCQDISNAGNGIGIEGERSGLFREIMRAVDAIRPTWIFLENSKDIRTKGRHVVIGEIVARGYSWRDGILAADTCGAPHERKRWWCLAKRTDSNSLRELQPQGCEQDKRRRFGDMDEEVPNSDCKGLEEWYRRQGEARTCATSFRCDWWATEPGMDRVVDGLANRAHRIKALGNGQVPLCAAVAWKILSNEFIKSQ